MLTIFYTHIIQTSVHYQRQCQTLSKDGCCSIHPKDLISKVDALEKLCGCIIVMKQVKKGTIYYLLPLSTFTFHVAFHILLHFIFTLHLAVYTTFHILYTTSQICTLPFTFCTLYFVFPTISFTFCTLPRDLYALPFAFELHNTFCNLLADSAAKTLNKLNEHSVEYHKLFYIQIKEKKITILFIKYVFVVALK